MEKLCEICGKEVVEDDGAWVRDPEGRKHYFHGDCLGRGTRHTWGEKAEVPFEPVPIKEIQKTPFGPTRKRVYDGRRCAECGKHVGWPSFDSAVYMSRLLCPGCYRKATGEKMPPPQIIPGLRGPLPKLKALGNRKY